MNFAAPVTTRMRCGTLRGGSGRRSALARVEKRPYSCPTSEAASVRARAGGTARLCAAPLIVRGLGAVFELLVELVCCAAALARYVWGPLLRSEGLCVDPPSWNPTKRTSRVRWSCRRRLGPSALSLAASHAPFGHLGWTRSGWPGCVCGAVACRFAPGWAWRAWGPSRTAPVSAPTPPPCARSRADWPGSSAAASPAIPSRASVQHTLPVRLNTASRGSSVGA